MNNGRRGRYRCYDCGAVFEPWEEMFTWPFGKERAFLCCDCFDSMFSELGLYEKAALIGSEVVSADFKTVVPS